MTGRGPLTLEVTSFQGAREMASPIRGLLFPIPDDIQGYQVDYGRFEQPVFGVQ